jgi:hypothetical protein
MRAGWLLTAARDPHGIIALVNFQFFDVGFVKQFDQFLDFANIHDFFSLFCKV